MSYYDIDSILTDSQVKRDTNAQERETNTDTLNFRNCHVHLSSKCPAWEFWKATQVKMFVHDSSTAQLRKILTIFRSKLGPGSTSHYGWVKCFRSGKAFIDWPLVVPRSPTYMAILERDWGRLVLLPSTCLMHSRSV